ncbi:MAG TPA: 5-deoxy-glucuronate isomerase [Roseiarcus sp.]|nr:5-deoxy-glucuronate isomerase [Roseiarcus sp.]
MVQSQLLVHPKRSSGGVTHSITPESAGWRYVGFETRSLQAGETSALATADKEVCIVILSGKARIKAGDFDSGVVGDRESVFDGAPWSVYLPPQANGAIEAASDCEVALCSAPATGKLKARVIPPSEVGTLTRGAGANARHVRNILPEDAQAERLLVVEVITPGGHWSSYPPHKHDRDALPDESYLEETYYHRVSPPQGFAFQRVYTDDRSLDETLTVSDGDVVLVPRGYHPVGAPHGYDLYYLNVMAGPKRVWRFHNDPAHEWLMK